MVVLVTTATCSRRASQVKWQVVGMFTSLTLLLGVLADGMKRWTTVEGFVR